MEIGKGAYAPRHTKVMRPRLPAEENCAAIARAHDLARNGIEQMLVKRPQPDAAKLTAFRRRRPAGDSIQKRKLLWCHRSVVLPNYAGGM